MNLDECLPPQLRGATLTRTAAGNSGAGVYRVELGGEAFILKISSDDPVKWRRQLQLQQLAAAAGLAPEIVHVDEARRAVVTAFVVDRSFPAYFMDPRSRPAALELLARTVRKVHSLPLPADAEHSDPRAFLAGIWAGLGTGFNLPGFVGDLISRVLAEAPLPSDRAVVLSHNDANPTNFAYDGERLLFLDWDTAGANDPFFDLAVLAVFLRMDAPTCKGLLEAYDGRPAPELPARFVQLRRLAAALPGAMFLHLARAAGHPGGAETIEQTASLSDCYQRMRTGALSIATPEGKWALGLALLKESLAL